MALFEEKITDTIEAGAPPLKYEGDIERQREIAQQIWDQMSPELRMQFGNFDQFFSSGAWKEVMKRLMSQQGGRDPEVQQEGSAVQATGIMGQAPDLPQTPQPAVGPGAMAQGPRNMAPRPMARGGISDIDFFAEERGPQGIEEENINVASHPINTEILERLYEEHYDILKSRGHSDDEIEEIIMNIFYEQGMADGGRIGFGLGSFVKKAFKKAKRAVKKIAKSPIGKAALLYAGTAGLGNLAAGASRAPWLSGSWLNPTAVRGNLGKIPGYIMQGDPTRMNKEIGLNKLKGFPGLANLPGGIAKWGLGAAMAAPFIFPNPTQEEEQASLTGYADSPDLDLEAIRQAAVTNDPATLATQYGQHFSVPTASRKYSIDDMRLLYGLPQLAQGGRIGYDKGGSTWREFLEDQNVVVDPSDKSWRDTYYKWLDQQKNKAQGGRIEAQEGGLMDLGGMEKDYREEGGFVPIGEYEKKDDVPARLSKNEFVFTADAVRGAGEGDIDKGADRLEDLMEKLEDKGKQLNGARDMFAVSERISEVV